MQLANELGRILNIERRGKEEGGGEEQRHRRLQQQ